MCEPFSITYVKLFSLFSGILSPDDARLAAEKGASGVMVSNHGGRNLDQATPTLSVVEAVADAVRATGTGCQVYMDGGVRSGADAFKALALGARMVLVGRPALWGLAHGGKAGVELVLDLLQEELEETMGLCGCQKVQDIERQSIIARST